MLQPGEQIGRYIVTRRLGQGGMGSVMLAHDTVLERHVALKLLDAPAGDALARAKVLREARAASALNHPSICTIYEVGEADGRAFIAMEHIDGKPVADLTPLPLETALRHSAQAADALAHAHDRGIVHGDLKAANAILPGSGALKIVDFGLARRVLPADSATLTMTGTREDTFVAGTPYALAPEQVRGQPAHVPSDLWALGILLFEMLTGAKPFSGATLQDVFSAILRDPPAALPPHVPIPVADIVRTCLAKDPAQRYRRAADVRLVLEVALENVRSGGRASALTTAGEFVAPPIVQTAPPHGLLGREAELDELERAWTRSREGQPQVVLLPGEPGIGKTSLALAFARRAAAEGATVLVGRCDEEALVPYQPFAEALAWFVRECPEDDLTRHVAAAQGGAELAQIVADLVRRRPELQPAVSTPGEGQRYRLFQAVADFLGSAAATRPLVLVLDDVQWADKPTLQLLRHIVRVQHRARLLIVATYRDGEVGRTHPLADTLAELRRDPSVSRIALRGLGETPVRDLMASMIGPGSAAAATAIHEVTGGNPFFVGEILRHARETGVAAALRGGGASSLTALGLPESVRDVIGRRLSRTSEACNRTLAQAAAIGREFDVSLLMALGDVAEETLLDALDEAQRSHLIAPVPGRGQRFTFTHALIRETLYEESSPVRRARLHRRVGEALERRGGDHAQPPLADLAFHFFHAASPEVAAKAVDYASRAGDRAADALAYEEAARFYDMALQAIEHGENPQLAARRLDLHTRRARAFAALAQWAAEKREAELALGVAPPDALEQRAELVLTLAATSFYLLDIPAVRRFASDALALARQVDRGDLAADALGWLGRCLQADGDLLSAMDADRAATALGGGRRGVALHHGPLTLYLAGRTGEAVEAGARAVDHARRSADGEFAMYGLSHHALALGAAGRYADAEQMFAEAREFGRKYGVLPPLARSIAMHGGMRMAIGDYEGADALHREARELARSINFTPTVVSAGIDLLMIDARRGTPGRSEGLLSETAEAIVRTPGWHEWLWKLRLGHARAELALARGDVAAARADADVTIARARSTRRPKYEALALVTRAWAAQRSGERQLAIADAHAAVAAARTTADPALQLNTLATLLALDGCDELQAEADRLRAAIRAALPTAVMRERFDRVDFAATAAGGSPS
jgi:tetratricopeptide (TPR) repeat protein/KaiC/GvpD/RAD55 family RecA-like ATPase